MYVQTQNKKILMQPIYLIYLYLKQSEIGLCPLVHDC
jgi:hypothetical protein